MDFIQEILDDIGPGTPERRRCFLMDNLITHRHPIIAQMIMAAGHRIVYRAPYYPVDGPIEYVFNTIQQELAYRMHYITDMPTLHGHINAIVASLDDFQSYFLHCGF
jgi:transposase